MIHDALIFCVSHPASTESTPPERLIPDPSVTCVTVPLVSCPSTFTAGVFVLFSVVVPDTLRFPHTDTLPPTFVFPPIFASPEVLLLCGPVLPGIA